MSTDKLADALESVEALEHEYLMGGTRANAEDMAAWLRSPRGIKLLAEDETIREGIRREIENISKRHTIDWVSPPAGDPIPAMPEETPMTSADTTARPWWVRGCGQPIWAHETEYCGPGCEEWEDPNR